MTDCALIKTRLAEALTAQHNLNMGIMPRVVVDQNGERVEFTAANASRLAAYIAQLQALNNACLGCGAGSQGNRPLTFLF